MIKKITIDTAIDLEANEEAFSSQTMPLKGAYKLNKIFHEIADLTDASKQQFNNLIIEYSEKDDKFRLVTSGCPFIKSINVARITKCNIYKGEAEIKSTEPEITYETITLKVKEERNSLERCMLHFAHFDKRAEKFDDHYLLHIKFVKDDESEMVIRVLSFGPTVEVLGSENFKQLIINKLKNQKSCGLL